MACGPGPALGAGKLHLTLSESHEESSRLHQGMRVFDGDTGNCCVRRDRPREDRSLANPALRIYTAASIPSAESVPHWSQYCTANEYWYIQPWDYTPSPALGPLGAAPRPWGGTGGERAAGDLLLAPSGGQACSGLAGHQPQLVSTPRSFTSVVRAGGHRLTWWACPRGRLPLGQWVLGMSSMSQVPEPCPRPSSSAVHSWLPLWLLH